MASFKVAIRTVLKHEGGYSDVGGDRGGKTVFGISSRFLKKNKIKIKLKEITRKRAIDLYRKHFWRYEHIGSQILATKIFDIAVNSGPSASHRLLQRSLTGMGLPCKADGIMGPKTLALVNGGSPVTRPKKILKELRARQSVRYAEIVLRRPSQKKFLLGWMRRAAL